MDTLTYSGTLVVRKCWCGIRHAIPAELDRELERDRRLNAYCPVGHSYVFAGPSDAEREAKRERERRQRAEDRAARLTARLDQTEASLRATKGHLTRARKRAAAALCPVPGCKRQIVQMDRHLRAKHADWLAGHGHADEGAQ